ncbi:hypothetical protein D1BOALGB6SA_3219 [Olavius sp. associated proteobacterium Delta 1]|nr:hypothetical protein D1BOALGB6SA_3219 [Olavius sp. associated proteobacterium Delta 1]
MIISFNFAFNHNLAENHIRSIAISLQFMKKSVLLRTHKIW